MKKQVIKDFKNVPLEHVPGTTTTIQGSALSVYELYQKMIVGSIDAAGYVHPIEYDERPDIDNPDPLNTMGLDVGEVEEIAKRQLATFETERLKAKAAKEQAKKEKDQGSPAPDPQRSPEDGQKSEGAKKE